MIAGHNHVSTAPAPCQEARSFVMPKIGLGVRYQAHCFFLNAKTPRRQDVYGLNHKATKITKVFIVLKHEDHKGHEGFYCFESQRAQSTQRAQRLVMVINPKNLGDLGGAWRLGGYVFRFAFPFGCAQQGCIHPQTSYTVDILGRWNLPARRAIRLMKARAGGAADL